LAKTKRKPKISKTKDRSLKSLFETVRTIVLSLDHRLSALPLWADSLLILLGLFLIGVVFLQTSRFQWLGAPFPLPEDSWFLLFAIGLVLAGAGLRGLPSNDSKKDIPRWLAYPLLAFVFGVGVYLRFYRADQAYLAYWDDSATVINQALGISEAHYFKIIYPEGANEPLFAWVTGIVWSIFPGLKPLFIQRLGSNIFTLTTLWVLYRLGREISGKRYVGILLMALVAASKPALLHNLSAQAPLALMLSTSLFLWFQLRVLKKPDLRHFLQWGAVLGICLFTYNAIRPWFFVFAVGTLGWILWHIRQEGWKGAVKKQAFKHLIEGKKDWVSLVLDKSPLWLAPLSVLLFAVLYLLFFLDHIFFIMHDNPFSKLWGGNQLLWFFWQAFFGVLFVRHYLVHKGAERRLYAWALGLLLAGFLSQPIALQTEAAARIGRNSLLPHGLAAWFSPDFIHRMIYQVDSGVRFLFLSGEDRGDMNVVGDPFFDFHAIVIIFLGLALAAVKPSWLKTFVVLCAPLGMVPFLLTNDSYSAKLLGTLIPFLLLATLALAKWIDALWSGPKRTAWMALLLVLGLSGFWAWEIQGTYTRVFDKWWTDIVNDDMAVGQVIDEAMADKRVYLVPNTDVIPGRRFYSSTNVQAILQDGYPVYLCHDANPIEVLPGAPRKDVRVVVSGSSVKAMPRLKKEFPKAQWTAHWQFYQDPKREVPFLYCVDIPASEIPDKPGKMFQFRTAPAVGWLRRVYLTGFGLRGGMIDLEGIDPTINPVPPDWNGRAVSADGEWNAPSDGTYRFSMTNPNLSKVWVDGKILLHNAMEGESNTVSGSVSLKKGDHHVRYFTYLMYGPQFPDVTIENPSLNLKEVLGNP